MAKFEWVKGFTPGLHCTEICHNVKGELALLPVPLHPDPYSHRNLYCCDACYPSLVQWLKRSHAAYKGVATRRRKGGKRAPK